MRSFIKAVEIFTPDESLHTLELKKGVYGKLQAFEEGSATITFTKGEGLPGKAWEAEHPIVLTDLHAAYFKRTDLADEVGITAGIALPIFCGSYLKNVVVFFCGDKEEHAGAIELWSKRDDSEMKLVEGYFGTMEEFEWISRNISIMRGQGLPGKVWQTGMPLAIEDMAKSATFMRSAKAIKAGITTALAIPAWMDADDGFVMSFLSAKQTPIARRYEIWVNKEDALYYDAGYCEEGTDLATVYGNEALSDEGVVLSAYHTGSAQLTQDAAMHPKLEHDYEAILSVPILEKGYCKAVILFCI